MKNILIIAGVALLLIGGGAWWSNTAVSDGTESAAGGIISMRGLHWHPELRIFIKGKEEHIPPNVGLGVVHSPLHTHEDLPVIHMEFSGKVAEEDTALGKFFEVWGKPFGAQEILGYRSGSDGAVRMYVNGEENFEFENYRMRDGDRIEIRYE